MMHTIEGINTDGLKRIYIDQLTVEYNKSRLKNLPVFRVWLQDEDRVIQAHNVMIRGWSEARYSAQEPDWTKAQVWVETQAPLTIIHEEN